MNKEESSVRQIGTYEFKGRSIPVYTSKYGVNDNEVQHVWQVLNPDAFYTGSMWVNNKTGEITYPDGVAPPIPTHEDSEIVPKFILIGRKEMDEEMKIRIGEELERSYFQKNEKWLKDKNKITKMTKRKRIEEILNLVVEKSLLDLSPRQFAPRLQEELDKGLDFSTKVEDLTTPELEDQQKVLGKISYQEEGEWRVLHYNI